MKLPPLVSPDEKLSAEEIFRYSRHLLIPDVGMEGQKRLKHSRVLVIGAGGLGSPALLYLAAAGVGRLGIVDFDVMEESNLQRQVIHGISRLGGNKAASAEMAIRELNPWVEVIQHHERLEASNALALIGAYDLVLDGTDNFATRYLVNDACMLAKKPYVWGSIFRFEGQASVFWEDAPGGSGLNYRDLYPSPPPPELAPSCSEGGVLGILCASIGAIMVTEAIKLITGIGDSLLGRLAIYDALDMQYRFLPLRRAPDRKPITELADYQDFCNHKRDVPDRDGIPSITTQELKTLRDSGELFTLIDVREQTEWDMVRIDGACHIPKDEMIREEVLARFRKDAPIILHCKLGSRSRKVLQDMQDHGFSNVRNLQGGIIAWIRDVEPHLPQY
ncbi:molybdopterin-synthase adenylyltransferase MoeB [Verminephrobacter aporrectodeae subsp. tuberculatae]|uniref:Molybdopterin-synthase adenylyltransferase MoeB n=1 Tax=Verminephrobacter aporrectodeae subsp. tuberculatae TaxID=1110392 RepID=A0ABT3KP54_9BURK|nr:molybdopterin-synthase adenylyltransferase MoeB [Verminephrobacter aporrectodeae]MCW5320094.1 molybdopterin-synthase adenylyltransferase MoeB [Verminephrobacter aporrectodeae subsp. tuberculatae]